MLIRISLIVAIIAGLTVGGLNFVKVKEKITTLQANLKEQTDGRQKAETELASTKKDLNKTTAALKQTKAELEAATEAKVKAEADVAVQTKRADKLTEDLNKTRQERDAAQADLAAYKATGVTPQQILGMNKEFKTLQDNLAVAETENKVLARKVHALQVALDRYVSPEKPVFLPAALKGKVLVADPKWNFVVLNVGENQGVLEYGELLVNRNGKLVAKIVVRSVQKDRCIANVLPGWELGEVMEGDLVIPAHPAS
jgi:septal ring factor EnvC (AmiA/AmiB activator)